MIFPDAAMVSAKRTEKPHRTRLLPPRRTPVPNASWEPTNRGRGGIREPAVVRQSGEGPKRPSAAL